MRPLRKGAMQTETNNVSGLQQLEHAAALRVLVAERLSNDFAAFVKKAWPVLHPARPMVWSWHYDLLCEYLIYRKNKNSISKRVLSDGAFAGCDSAKPKSR